MFITTKMKEEIEVLTKEMKICVNDSFNYLPEYYKTTVFAVPDFIRESIATSMVFLKHSPESMRFMSRKWYTEEVENILYSLQMFGTNDIETINVLRELYFFMKGKNVSYISESGIW